MKTFISLLLTLVIASVMKAGDAAPEGMQLFLLIGQSNMAGRGAVEPQDKVPHPRVFVLTKERTWAPAVDPLHFDKPAIAGVGLGSTFGRVIANERPGAVIGLIPAAFGGTSLDEWKPGGALYTNAVERTREAMKHGQLAGILWHQGENDKASELTASYPARFAAMMAQLRVDLAAPDVPVVVGEIGRFVAGSAAINAALAKVPEHVHRSAFVSAEGLTDKGATSSTSTPPPCANWGAATRRRGRRSPRRRRHRREASERARRIRSPRRTVTFTVRDTWR